MWGLYRSFLWTDHKASGQRNTVEIKLALSLQRGTNNVTCGAKTLAADKRSLSQTIRDVCIAGYYPDIPSTHIHTGVTPTGVFITNVEIVHCTQSNMKR